ncbi:MAG: DEAD/DEAH box helicase [Pirellula sp.]
MRKSNKKSNRGNGGTSQQAILRQLLSGLKIDSASALGSWSSSATKKDPFRNPKQRQFYESCRNAIRELAKVFTRLLPSPAEEALLQFEFQKVHSTGDLRLSVQVFELVPTFDDYERRYYDEEQLANEFKLFVSLNKSMPQYGCTCPDSMGSKPCVHIAQAVKELSNEEYELCLDFKDAVISDDIIVGPIDKSEFIVDTDKLAIEQVTKLVKSREEEAQPLDLLLAPAPKNIELDQGRIAWNFSLQSQALRLNPVLQIPKKNGGGYRKGSKISVQDVALKHLDVLKPHDKQILKLAQRSSYYSDHSIPPFEALKILVSAENVLYEDKPLTIVLGQLTVGVEVQQDESIRIILCTAPHQRLVGSVLVWDDLAVHFSDDKSVATVFQGDEETFKNVFALTKLPAVSKQRRGELLEVIKKLQGKISVVLPDSLGYRTMIDPTVPVLLLRSGKQGQLDYGLRVRTKGGRISLPGTAPTSWTDDSGEEKIQWVRNPRMESAQLTNLANQLNLELNAHLDYTGCISSFEDAINLLEKVETIRDQVEVLWDKDSEKPIRVLGSITAKSLKVEITSKRNWFGITGSCKLGDEEVPIEKLLESMNDRDNPLSSNYVRLADGQFAKIESELRKKLERVRNVSHLDRKSLVLDSTAAQEIQSLAEEEIQWKAAKAWEERMRKFQSARDLDPKIPAGLKADLRDYQVEGYKWLRRLSEWGVGGILADDMGLGKTLQTLAVLLDRAEEGPALVIAPTSVGFNWLRETQKFAPSLRPLLYRESDRKEMLSDLKNGDIVISSYALALRDGSDLAKIQWGTLVMDEAQAIKNGRSKTNQSIGELNAKWSIALTGTPMENHLGELWSLFNVVSPGVFGGWESFRNRFATPIEKHNDPVARENLAHRIQPFMLRRTKENVLKELPSRTEVVQYVDLSPEERVQYEAVRRSAIGEIQNLAVLPDIKDQRFKILALLTRLRQFACHPGIVNKNWERSSAKLDQLCSILENLKDEGHRALVFSQFTEHLALIRNALTERGISFQYLDGSTPATERQRRVDAFQNGNDVAFLISLKAGGTGLNLTAADYVIHMDPWWNPAVEDQATDRAHRMGQQKPVMVYRIVARGTIEEEILALHETKRDLVDGILDGTDASAKLSTKDLMDIIIKTNDIPS